MSQAEDLSGLARNYAAAPAAFENRIVLVTGATQGIGRAVAEALVRLGAQTILLGRRLKALDALHAELSQLGPEPAMALLDFEKAQGEQYNELTDQITERFGSSVLHVRAFILQESSQRLDRGFVLRAELNQRISRDVQHVRVLVR